MCLNIPRFAAVRSEIGRPNPSRFARAVWQELDIYLFNQVSAEHAGCMLRGAYDVIHDRVMRGERLPEPPVAALERKLNKVNPATPDQAQRHIAEIRELFETGTGGVTADQPPCA
jgi:hypothetical protein